MTEEGRMRGTGWPKMRKEVSVVEKSTDEGGRKVVVLF